MMMSKEKIANLREIFENQHEVVAAYLFGSVARETENEMSDIDIAVLLDNSSNAVSLIKRLTRLVSDALDTVSLDLTSLAHADISLRYNVIREGILIYEKNPAQRIAFERATTTIYLDMKPMWAEYDHQLKIRFQEYASSDR